MKTTIDLIDFSCAFFFFSLSVISLRKWNILKNIRHKNIETLAKILSKEQHTATLISTNKDIKTIYVNSREQQIHLSMNERVVYVYNKVTDEFLRIERTKQTARTFCNGAYSQTTLRMYFMSGVLFGINALSYLWMGRKRPPFPKYK